jgi:hypothetical protein
MPTPRRRFIRQGLTITSKFAPSVREIPSVFPSPSSARSLPIEAHRGETEQFSSFTGVEARANAKRGSAVLLLIAAAFLPATAAAQRAPQPIFTELFANDPAVPSQLLRKWRICSQLDSKLQPPLRFGVIKDSSIGKTVGRVTVQEGDGLYDAREAILEARHYIRDSEGSRAAAEAERGVRRARRTGGDPDEIRPRDGRR